MYSYSPTIANNKPHLPVLYMFFLLNNIKLMCLLFLLLTLWATNPFLFCRQHQESHQWALSEDPSKNLHDTVLVSPESEIRLGMDFGCYTRLLQDLSRFLEDFLFPKKRVRLETGYTPNIHPMSSTSAWPTWFAMGFLGHPSRPNGMDSDVPWPGYVNFSGEKKDDDYKAPLRGFGSLGLWEWIKQWGSELLGAFKTSHWLIFFMVKTWWKHVKTTNLRDFRGGSEMTSWFIRGSLRRYLVSLGPIGRWLLRCLRARCRIGSTIPLRLGTSWRMHATTGGPGLSSWRKIPLGKGRCCHVASALSGWALRVWECLRLQHLPFADSVTWRPGNGQSATMIFPHVFFIDFPITSWEVPAMFNSQRMAVFWVGCARNGN